MGLEVPCTLNPRWSAGCPDCVRSKSEGYAGGLPAGQTKSAQPLHDHTRPTPFSGKGAGSTRFPPTDHQPLPGKPLSVNCILSNQKLEAGTAWERGYSWMTGHDDR